MWCGLFVSPQNLTPNVMVLRGEAYKRLGHEGGILMNGISALTKETWELALAFCSLPCEDTMRRQLSTSQEEGPHQTWDLLARWLQISSIQNCEK